MKLTLRKYPWFVMLLPLFFVLHGYAAHADYLSFGAVFQLFLAMLAGAILIYGLFRITLKQPQKAGLMTLYFFGFYLFFGALFDFLKAYSPWKFVFKYSVLMTAFLVVALLLFILLRRSKEDLSRAVLFFNVLLLIFICVDLVNLGRKKLFPATPSTASADFAPIPDSCAKPDIYLLMFDEYTGNKALREYFHYDNSALDSFLLSRNFQVVSHSNSNYDYTNFSIASMLNMDYLHWYKPVNQPTRDDFILCNQQIRKNKVTEFLGRNGYELVNLSIFDIANHPARINQRFLATSTRLITEETFINRFAVEFGWFIVQYPFLSKIFPVSTTEDLRKEIENGIELTIRETTRKSDKPRFVYSHLMIPHSPYFFDQNGNKRNIHLTKITTDQYESERAYLDYLQFGNKQLMKMVNAVQQNNNKAVIMVMSDHGFRGNVPPAFQQLVFFNNQNAVFIPGNQNKQWPDSMTNVNQFRLLFNTLFAQKNPMLKDSITRVDH